MREDEDEQFIPELLWQRERERVFAGAGIDRRVEIQETSLLKHHSQVSLGAIAALRVALLRHSNWRLGDGRISP